MAAKRFNIEKCFPMELEPASQPMDGQARAKKDKTEGEKNEGLPKNASLFGIKEKTCYYISLFSPESFILSANEKCLQELSKAIKWIWFSFSSFSFPSKQALLPALSF